MKSLIEKMPNKPGIYFFKDIKDNFLYIGKSKDIKKRVCAHFKSKDIKSTIFTQKASDVDYLVTKDQREALILESNYIKKYSPRYNIVLKDDKTYPYIRITNENYPRVEIVRYKNLNLKKDKYFGPYTDVGQLRKVLKVIHNLTFIRTCAFRINERSIKTKKHQICLDYHIKKCEGPCEGLVGALAYKESIDIAENIILGKTSKILNFLKLKMKNSSDSFDYEKAALYRDQIKSLKTIAKTKKILSKDFASQDYISIYRSKKRALVYLIKIRDCKIIANDSFYIKSYSFYSDKDIFDNFLRQYYLNNQDKPDFIYTIIDNIYNDDDEKKEYGFRVTIKSPQSLSEKNIYAICSKNCNLKFDYYKHRKNKKNISKKIESLKKDLNLDFTPSKIEAFDISHISGKFQVGGMVFFKNGSPYKKGYRKFKIKHNFENNDYLSISEVVSRRYSRLKREENEFPDLILIDGGKGQLYAAKRSLDRLGLGFITVISLAKKLEEVYIIGSKAPLSIKKTSPGILLLREIRDEVHRFSIEYHRSLRSKSAIESKILEVKGLGRERLNILINQYGSVSNIKKKSALEICKETKIPISVCERMIKGWNL